ncbi:hypothetical protein M8818_007050 [Zalaria obscura]|uniref:Uncharacterized protein n=1 Tax=Zalaria obscura TaxID=2024903 RepID=A0ACC3S5S2_9PEZI
MASPLAFAYPTKQTIKEDKAPTLERSKEPHHSERSNSLPHIFKRHHFKSKGNHSHRRSFTPSRATDGSAQQPARPKHIPIIIPDYIARATDEDFSPTETVSPSTSLSIPGYDILTRPEDHYSARKSSPLPEKRAPRHVEIVIPTWAQPFTAASQPVAASPEKGTERKDSVFDNLSVPTSEMSRNTAGSSRTSTLDSTISTPSPDQLHSRQRSETALSTANSSTTSLAQRGGYESASEREIDQDQDEDSPRQRQQSTPQQASTASPATAQTPNAAQSATGSSSLSGLVCNVHRTTGKEPHALVGASTTVLGDKLYVFGGRRISRTRPSLTADMYELDLLRRHWTKLETKGDMPSPRYFHSMCALGDNKLVCYGGMSPEDANDAQDPQVSVMSDIHIYDAPTRTWMRVNTAEAPQGRYAHCAAILPSSAVFASANAPMSAIQHNPASTNPNQGSIGVTLDGTGGAEMIVVGGQDSANHYIEQISVFNLRSLKWTSTRQMSGRSCGAYRSVVTPLTTMSAGQIGAGSGRAEENDDDNEDDADANLSGAPMLIYSNYNFLDVKLELQIRLPDGTLTEKQMQGHSSPPGLRFPSGGIIDNNFVVAGTFLTSSKQEYALWSLDLRTMAWARIDTGSSVFSHGSWNRGVIWPRRNSFIILGNRKRNLVDDYNNRRLNFTHICLVQLEAFGLYNNPRRSAPASDYISISAPLLQHNRDADITAGGRQLTPAAEELGEQSLMAREFCDMEFLAMDGTRIPVNSRLVARRWGPGFNALLKESSSSLDGTDTATLRPVGQPSRNSSITITPSINSTFSGATTLTANTVRAGSIDSTATADVPDPRAQPPSTRSRILYLPHTVRTLQALLHYLYTSSLPAPPSPLATPQILCSLLQLARPYKIDGLVEHVIERLHESLDGRNAAAIFNATAMAAGGGDGIAFAAANQNVIPPRSSSIGGLNVEGLNLNGSSRNNALRIDTDMANGRSTRNTFRDQIDEEEELPDSASTTGSQFSTQGQKGRREDKEVWSGEWSAVIGLQKRGLRGLMEGRRIRERGRSEGGNGGNQESARVGLGIA